MTEARALCEELRSLCRLFSYPEYWPAEGDLQVLAEEDKARWAANPGQGGLQMLQSQYVSLFINALPGVPCPPCGSFYLEGALMGESTVWVDSLYRKYGLETDEIPDHIAVELEFLGFLADPRASARQEDFDALLDHLRSWAPGFLERVHEHDDSGFYRAVSAVAATRILQSSGRFPHSRCGSGIPVEGQQNG